MGSQEVARHASVLANIPTLQDEQDTLRLLLYVCTVAVLLLSSRGGRPHSFQQIDLYRHLLGEVKRQVMSAIG